LETNDSAVKVLGEPTLRQIAQELVRTVRANVTIDWTLRENVRAQLRVLVKRILRKHGYPPDKQEKATQTVLEQARCFRQNGRWHNFGEGRELDVHSSIALFSVNLLVKEYSRCATQSLRIPLKPY
jgi:hypothetical protein